MMPFFVCVMREFADNSVEECVDDFFNCVEALPDVSIERSDKARAHAYLTTKPNPHFKAASPSRLAEAYEQTRHVPVKSWKQAAADDMRDCLDRAAAATTGIDLETIRDWRARISREPTVSNEPATGGQEA